MNRRKRYKSLVTMFILLAVGVSALIIWVKTAKKSIVIYDFSRTIEYDDKSNYALTQTDLVATEILAADAKPEYVIDPSTVIGKYITGTCYKGQHVMSQQVQKDPTYVEVTGLSELAEYRKIYLPISYQSGFAGDIRSGQSVDLMFTETGTGFSSDRTNGLLGSENGINYAHTKIFMQNVPVYQVYTEDGDVYVRKTTDPETLNQLQGRNAATLSDEPASNKEKKPGPAYVALTVTVPQYEEISARQMYGTISLVSRFENSTDQDSNGYLMVKDGYADIFAGEGNLEYDHNVSEFMDNNQEPETTEGQEPARASIYRFLRRMAMFSMTEEQSERYKSIDRRYSEFMVKTVGEGWENQNPELYTDEHIQAAIPNDDTAMQQNFLQWKIDVETLAKELMGSNVVLPWNN